MNTLLRLLGILLGTTLAAGLFTACDDADGDADAGPVTFRLTIQDWTGWSREQPEPETSEVTVSEGDTFEVEVIGGPATFTVVDVDDDRVRLESDESFTVEDGGGNDLRDTETEFELLRDGRLDLVTPTLDAGTHVSLREL